MPSRDPLLVFFHRTWTGINARTVNGLYADNNNKSNVHYLKRGILLKFERAEYKEWCFKQREAFLLMLQRGERPSIDRIDSSGHYSLSNLRIVPLKTNSKAGNAERIRLKHLAFATLPVRKCLACGAELKRKTFKGAGKLESLKPFLLRKTCNRKCLALVRPKSHKGKFAKWKN